MDVAESNTEAHQAWNSDSGEFWAAHAAQFDAFVSEFHRRFLAAAEIVDGDRILDVGCGNGQPTRDAARLARTGSALGIDLSAGMLERARGLAAEQGVTNARFLHADAQIHPFDPDSFDVALSRNGVMFFGDPVAAFSNIARSLRPGGRLVLLVWQAEERNPWATELQATLPAEVRPPQPSAGSPGAFALGDPEHTRTILEGGGFVDVSFEDVTEHVHLGPDVESAYEFARGLGFVRRAVEELPEAERQGMLSALRGSLEAHATPGGVRYGAAMWIVHATVS